MFYVCLLCFCFCVLFVLFCSFESSKIKDTFLSPLLTEVECLVSPIGVSSPSIIPDSFIRASTTYTSYYQPAYARLHDYRGGGWCALYQDDTPNDWLQIEFGRTIEVCGVATQGNGFEWVTEFKLSFSLTGDSWETYTDTQGVTMVRLHFIFKHSFQLRWIFPFFEATFKF